MCLCLSVVTSDDGDGGCFDSCAECSVEVGELGCHVSLCSGNGDSAIISG